MNCVVVLLNVRDDHPAVRRVVQTWQDTHTHRQHVWAKHPTLKLNWNKHSVRSCWSIPLPHPQVYCGALPSGDGMHSQSWIYFPIKEKKRCKHSLMRECLRAQRERQPLMVLMTYGRLGNSNMAQTAERFDSHQLAASWLHPTVKV